MYANCMIYFAVLKISDIDISKSYTDIYRYTENYDHQTYVKFAELPNHAYPLVTVPFGSQLQSRLVFNFFAQILFPLS